MNQIHIQPGTSPNEVQKAMIARRYGMFIHYGMNTFLGHEWTDGTHPPETFAPSAIDTDDWASAAAEAGMKYIILTTKHHEGFCIWPTRQTRHAVAGIDVVGQLAESCRKYDIELGLYYSLWDRNWEGGVMRDLAPPAMDAAASRRYVDYMKAQLEELLTQYGPICELWFDGGWPQPRAFWNIPEVYELVKSLQPNCALGVNCSIGHPDEPDTNWPDKPLGALIGTYNRWTKWGGEGHYGIKPPEQREGYPIRYFPSDFRLIDPELPVEGDPKCFTHNGETYYLPLRPLCVLTTAGSIPLGILA